MSSPPSSSQKKNEKKSLPAPMIIAKWIICVFSNSTARRDPPTILLTTTSSSSSTSSPSATSSSTSGTQQIKKTQHIRLITIGASHFCEKARWGLDLIEIDPNNPYYYTEDAHASGFHLFQTLQVGDKKQSVTPVVLFDSSPAEAIMNGKNYTFLYESNVILEELCPFLYPKEIKDQVQVMEMDVSKRLGETLRRYCYHHLLQKGYYPVLIDIVTKNCSSIEKILFSKMIDKGIDTAIRKRMNINEITAQQAMEELRKVYEEISNRLIEHQQPCIMDTTTQSYGFTAVDLSFCALSYPLLQPDCMKEHFCCQDITCLPPGMQLFIQELRSTKAGQYVLQTYEKHRPKDVKTGHVIVKYSNQRDNIPITWKITISAAAAITIIGTIGVALVAMYYGGEPKSNNNNIKTSLS